MTSPPPESEDTGSGPPQRPRSGPVEPWSLDSLRPPFDRDRPSILSHVESHLTEDGAAPPPGSLTPMGAQLPDADHFEGDLDTVPGAHDGVMRHDERSETDHETLDLVGAALGAVLTGPPDEDLLRGLHELAAETRALSYVDALSDRLLAWDDLPADRLHATGRWLAERSPDREAVKLGLALLGLLEGGDDLDLLQTLGRHEELTLFAALAIAGAVVQPDRELFDLARAVHGWGRIATVELLAGTEDREIRSWILRAGYRNDVLDEYLAHTAATTGDLLGALATGTPSSEVVRAGGEILSALLSGGPGPDISDYEDAAAAVDTYVRVVETGRLDVHSVVAVKSLHGFLASPRAVRAMKRENGWSQELRVDLVERLGALLSRHEVREIVTSELEGTEGPDLEKARLAAFLLDIDGVGDGAPSVSPDGQA